MHKDILTLNQLELLPLLRNFKREYYLVEGTAIALYLGHRRSVDFDLFKQNGINPKRILDTLSKTHFRYIITRRVVEQLNLTMHDVKLTFFQYPYKISAKRNVWDTFRVPELIDLAAMKAFALGRRSKWKDYVDLYFLLKDHFTVDQISSRAVQIYDQLFSEKLFRSQLPYFDDIDYHEPVEFMGTPVPEEEIKSFLIEQAIGFTDD